MDFEDLPQRPVRLLYLRPDGRITAANDIVARWLGLTAAGLEGRPLRDVLSTPGRILFETNLAPALRIQGGFEEVLVDLITAAGDKLPVTANASGRRAANGEIDLNRIALFRSRERRSYKGDLHTRARRRRIDAEIGSGSPWVMASPSR